MEQHEDHDQGHEPDSGEKKCVDQRPFECPNGHGLLKIESATSVWCEECGYSRTVFESIPESESDTHSGTKTRREAEVYVCNPCKATSPETAGVIRVPGGTESTVWCPWCGDAMEYHSRQPDPMPTHFVVAEINGVRIYTDPHTFQADAQKELELLSDAPCIEDPEVVSYND